MYLTSIGSPAFFVISSFCETSISPTPEPTVPKPIIAIFIVFKAFLPTYLSSLPVGRVKYYPNELKSTPVTGFGQKYVDFCGIFSPKREMSLICEIFVALIKNEQWHLPS